MGNIREQFLAFRVPHRAPALLAKQARSQRGFQRLDVLAHGAFGHIHFLGSSGMAFQTANGFKYPQGIKPIHDINFTFAQVNSQ